MSMRALLRGWLRSTRLAVVRTLAAIVLVVMSVGFIQVGPASAATPAANTGQLPGLGGTAGQTAKAPVVTITTDDLVTIGKAGSDGAALEPQLKGVTSDTITTDQLILLARVDKPLAKQMAAAMPPIKTVSGGTSKMQPPDVEASSENVGTTDTVAALKASMGLTTVTDIVKLGSALGGSALNKARATALAALYPPLRGAMAGSKLSASSIVDILLVPGNTDLAVALAAEADYQNGVGPQPTADQLSLINQKDPTLGATLANAPPPVVPASVSGGGVNPNACVPSATTQCFKSPSLTILSNGLAYYALLMCVAGILISAILWAVGSKGQNPGHELAGKKGIIVCCTAAFFIGALPTMIGFLSDTANKVKAEASVADTPSAVPVGSNPAGTPATPAASYDIGTIKSCTAAESGTAQAKSDCIDTLLSAAATTTDDKTKLAAAKSRSDDPQVMNTAIEQMLAEHGSAAGGTQTP